MIFNKAISTAEVPSNIEKVKSCRVMVF